MSTMVVTASIAVWYDKDGNWVEAVRGTELTPGKDISTKDAQRLSDIGALRDAAEVAAEASSPVDLAERARRAEEASAVADEQIRSLQAELDKANAAAAAAAVADEQIRSLQAELDKANAAAAAAATKTPAAPAGPAAKN